eukprot:CAMPEP_0201582742 /NCGR_PEP_ID=MMETSP0190_2-20130828/89979_1 /ASSEMBLY_ACC=CAM_ASM_000263 /TAXON_ID=37353 /ORGANISM="Rosalina sp." /LENGTH=410 /DNA_ID=CAMNT_0048023329 /DNA_START=78 /DNA_END=1310 /DNA_ORIENTATION=-
MSIALLLLASILANSIDLIKSAEVVNIQGLDKSILSTEVVYALKSVSSNRYLDGGNNEPYAQMTTENVNISVHKFVQWKIVKAGGDHWALQSVSSGRYLDGGFTELNAQMTTAEVDPATHKFVQWDFIKTNGGKSEDYPNIALKSVSSGKYLDGGKTEFYAQMTDYDPTNYIYEQWIIVPVDQYKITAAISDFDFGEEETIQEMFEQNKQVAFYDKQTIYVFEGGVGLTKQGSYGQSVEESYSFGFSQSIGIGISATLSASIPLVGSAEVSVSTDFEFSSNQQHTTTKTKDFEQSYEFEPQETGTYEVGMTVYEDTDVKLPFKSKVIIKGTDKEGNTLSGKQLQGVIYLKEFNCVIKDIHEDSIEAEITGTMKASFSVEAETYAKKIGDIQAKATNSGNRRRLIDLKLQN